MHIEVPRPPKGALTKGATGEDSATVQARVTAAHYQQLARSGIFNGRLSETEIRTQCRLRTADRGLLESATAWFGLSARACAIVSRNAIRAIRSGPP